MIRVEPVPFDLPRAPAWARPSGDLREISEAEALFFAGAALAALDSVAKSEPPWAGAWRARLALKSAAAVAQNLLKRREDEAALRDAVALAKPGQDLGPAGRVYSAFRTLCGPGDPFRRSGSPPSPPSCRRRSTWTGQGSSPRRSKEVVGRGRPAPLVAAAAAAAVVASARRRRAARALLSPTPRWPGRSPGRSPLPLLAGELFARDFRAKGGGRARARPAGASSWRSPTPARRSPPSTSPTTCPAAPRGSPKPRQNCAPKERRSALEALLADDAVSAAAPLPG